MAANGPEITKAGSTPLKKVGHTFGNKHGLNPLAKARGTQAPSPATYK